MTVVPSASQALLAADPVGEVGPSSARTDQEQQPQSGPSRYTVSAAFCAFIGFACINIVLAAGAAPKFDRYEYSARGWPWWILDDLRQHAKPHNVALLGSSLMVSAVAGCDANYLNKNLDQTAYHNAAYVDHVLATTFGGSYKTIDLAIPGQMPSDAYMILSAVMDLNQHPRIVFYGIAPRDFIDSTLKSPSDTETFQYLSRVVDVRPISSQLFKDPVTKFNRFLENAVFLYGQSLHLQLAQTRMFTAFVDAVLPTPVTSHPFTYWDRTKLLPEYKKCELYPTAMIASPLEQTFSASRFTDNTGDYVNRYRNPRSEIFKTQMFFLSKVAGLCKRNQTQLVLLNMPLTKKNVSILGDRRYSAYLDSIGQFSVANNVPFFDLNDLDRYSIQDFHDLVHLNGCGAKKFFDDLGEVLAKDANVATLIKEAGLK